MQNHAAVFRTADSLQEGCRKMETLYKSLFDLKVCLTYFCKDSILNLFPDYYGKLSLQQVELDTFIFIGCL